MCARVFDHWRTSSVPLHVVLASYAAVPIARLPDDFSLASSWLPEQRPNPLDSSELSIDDPCLESSPRANRIRRGPEWSLWRRRDGGRIQRVSARGGPCFNGAERRMRAEIWNVRITTLGLRPRCRDASPLEAFDRLRAIVFGGGGVGFVRDVAPIRGSPVRRPISPRSPQGRAGGGRSHPVRRRSGSSRLFHAQDSLGGIDLHVPVRLHLLYAPGALRRGPSHGLRPL